MMVHSGLDEGNALPRPTRRVAVNNMVMYLPYRSKCYACGAPDQKVGYRCWYCNDVVSDYYLRKHDEEMIRTHPAYYINPNENRLRALEDGYTHAMMSKFDK